MSDQDKIAASKLKKAFESVDEATLLFGHGHYNSTVSHLYHAVFYAALAATLQRGIVTKTHSGTKNQFHQTFVKNGLISLEDGKLYDRLMRMRNEGDYGDFATFTKEEAGSLFEEVKTFLRDIQIIVSGNK